MSTTDEQLKKDFTIKEKFILISLCVVSITGIIDGLFIRLFDVASEKIVLSGGLALSFYSLYLIVKSKKLKIKGREFDSHTPLTPRRFKWGGRGLLIGFLFQFIGIWLNYFRGSSAIANTSIATNLPVPKEISWETIKLIMETQDKLATYGLIILGIVVTVWFAINLYIFIYPARKINTIREDLEKQIEAKTGEYLEKAKAEIAKVKGEIIEETNNLLLDPKADINMLVGITAKRGKSYDAAASNYAAAVRDYNKLRNDINLRAALKMLRDVLVDDLKKLENEEIEKIGRIVSEVSDLSSDKDQILGRLKKFREDKV